MIDIIGKTVSMTRMEKTWDGRDIGSLVVVFTDGTSLVVSAMTHKGCEHCDNDGAVTDFLDFAQRDENGKYIGG